MRDSAEDFSLFLVLYFCFFSHFEQKKKKISLRNKIVFLCSFFSLSLFFCCKPIFTDVFSSDSSFQICDHRCLCDHFSLPSISISSIETNETSSLSLLFVFVFVFTFVFVGIGIENRAEETLIRSVERLRRDRRDIGSVLHSSTELLRRRISTMVLQQ